MLTRTAAATLALAAACGQNDKKNEPAGSASAAVETTKPLAASHAARQAFIDDANKHPGAVFRASFGDDDTELLVEFTDNQTACTAEVLNKFAEPLGAAAQAAGFEHLSCKPQSLASPPIEVTAVQMFADYQANEVSADAKYRGKVLEITGIVIKIAKDVLDKPYVELQVRNQFEYVKASFDNESAVISLKRGEKIVAKCRGGGSSVGTPMLDDCVIEHVFERVLER